VASVYGPQMTFKDPKITDIIDEVLTQLWSDLRDVKWTKKFLEHYGNIEFPFREIERKPFKMTRVMTVQQIETWISTWAALATFRHLFPEKKDPTVPLFEKLRSQLAENFSEVTWKGTLVLCKL